MSSADSRRALVVAPNWIGDALMTQPLLRLLRQRHPDMQLDVLAPAATAPVYGLMPEVCSVRQVPFAHGKLQWGLRRQLARELRGARYQRAYVLPNSAKSALVPWLAAIPQRIGHRGESRFFLINQQVATPKAADGGRAPMVEHYARLALDDAEATPTLAPPLLQISSAAAATVRQQFNIPADAPMLALCPGAEYGPAKRWPATHVAGLIRLASQQVDGLHVVLLGGKGDQAIAASIIEHAHSATSAAPTPAQVSPPTRATIHDLCGKTALHQAFELLASATAVVSNDSGLMHAAAALNRPLVAVFGSTDPHHTPPLSDQAQIVSLGLPCSPCFKRECPLQHLRCLNDLDPQRVWQALARHFGAPNQAKLVQTTLPPSHRS